MTTDRRAATTRDADRSAVDDVDRRLVAALVADPLATYRALADVVGVSPRTVQRRYEELRGAGLVRVVGRTLPGFEGRLSWLLRIAVAADVRSADGVDAAASALARVQRVRWVRGSRDRRTLVAGVVSSAAELEPVLRGLPDGVELEIVELFTRFGATHGAPASDAKRPLDSLDRRLIALLEHDARADAQTLGNLLGVDPTTVLRRRQKLVGDGVLSFETDADVEAFVDDVDLLVTADVRPGAIRAVGETLAARGDVTLAAATGGAHAIVAVITVPADADIVDTVDAAFDLDGVTAVQVLPLGRVYKRLAG